MKLFSDYPGRPVEIKKGVEFDDGKAIIDLNGKKNVIDSSHLFFRVKATIDGLLEDLAPGSILADKFADEFLPEYEKAIANDSKRPNCGTVFYYPTRGDLVWYAPKFWHNIALLSRNSLLIRDKKQVVTWEQQRELFKKVVVGVAGASVGKNAFLRIIDTLQPEAIKIADPRAYKDTNSSRTTLAYWEIGENKAVIAARQAHANNPYINISVFSDGINAQNETNFINGLTYLVEETDDPDTKIRLRILARRHRIPVFMISDIGIATQIDFMDYQNDPGLPLSVGVRDDVLLAAQESWHKDRANRELFFKFAFKLTGDDWKNVPEFHDLVLKKIESPFTGGVPQLGVAAHKGACEVALMIAMKELGYKIPQRSFFNPRSATGILGE